MEKSINKKNFIWNSIGATANAFVSLLFSIVVTRINGSETAGIFIYSFATACLLYFIGNYCGRTFQVTDTTNKNSDTDYIYNRLITCIAMIIIAVVFTIIKGYDIYKSTILVIVCLYKCLEAFSESLYAIIQKREQLFKVGISMFLKALISFIVFLLIDLITKDLIVSCLSTVVVNIVFILLYDFKNIRKINIDKTKFSKAITINLLKIGFFTFILTFLNNYLLNTARYAIDDLSTNNVQTVFGIIIMPATFMSLIGQYIIQPSLTKISMFIKDKQYFQLKKITIKLSMVAIGIGLFALIMAYFFEVPVLELIYGLPLKEFFISMLLIIIGSMFYALGFIISTVLIALRKTLSQAITYVVVSIISTVMAYYMVANFNILGAGITYLISTVLIAVVFMGILMINMKKNKKEWCNNENINNNSNI